MTQYSAPNITLIKDVIQRPDEPRHFMTIEQSAAPAKAEIDGIVIAQSQAPLIVREVARSIYDPVFYFPRTALVQGELVKKEHTTHCPLKGDACYFDLALSGQTYHDAVWSYEALLYFDPRLKQIEGYLGFMSAFARISLNAP